MSNRKNDLEAERNSIWAFIESVEKEKKQTFLDAFDTVDTGNQKNIYQDEWRQRMA